MTRKEAIGNLNMIRVAFIDTVTVEQGKIIDDTFRAAIKALEQEPCNDAISRKAVLDTTICEGISCNECSFNEIDGEPGCLLHARINELSSVTQKSETVTEFADRCRECGAKYGKLLKQEPKTGHWVEIAKYSDGRHEIECSECGSHIFDRGHANSYIVKEKYKYCPRCGFRMVEPQESEEV